MGRPAPKRRKFWSDDAARWIISCFPPSKGPAFSPQDAAARVLQRTHLDQRLLGLPTGGRAGARGCRGDAEKAEKEEEEVTKEAGGVVAGRRGRQLHQRLKTPRQPRGGSRAAGGDRDADAPASSKHVTEALCSRNVPALDTGPQSCALPWHAGTMHGLVCIIIPRERTRLTVSCKERGIKAVQRLVGVQCSCKCITRPACSLVAVQLV